MNWTLAPTDNLEQVLTLYRQLFDDSLNRENIHARAENSDLFFYVIRRNDQKSAGFAIFRCRKRDAELWQAGVLPEYRQQGAGTAMLDQGEQLMTQKGYSKLVVQTYNHWNIMISMLTRRGYRIRETVYSHRREDLKIILHKELKIRKEMRYALTERCNFNCLFCHNEGLGHLERVDVSNEYVASVLEEAVRMGHTDITFTGGEPLLKRKRLEYLLQFLGKMPDPPEVTLVTNGSRLDQQVVESLRRYPGIIKINLSLHATTEELFRRITRVSDRRMFHQVIDNVKMATSSGLKVKVNHVVLQNLNHRHLLEAIELARSLGASGIKFLELLVLENREDDYRMYYDFRAIENHIQPIAIKPQPKNLRQINYFHRDDSQFVIEVSRLTCAIGCSHCRESRDRTFSSDCSYHPCFVRHKNHYPIRDPRQLPDILSVGDRIIDGYAAKFGDSSPTLIWKENFIPNKREFFFHVPDPSGFIEFLKSIGFQLKNTLGYHLEYFWPLLRKDHWERCERMLKIGWDHHDQSKVDMVYTDHQYVLHDDVGLETFTTFLDSSGPMSFPTHEKALHFLDRMDFVQYLEMEWRIHVYKDGELEINVALADEKSTAKISGTLETAKLFLQRMKAYPGLVKPLRTPLMQFMTGFIPGQNQLS